ncbi:MAG: SGNH/GDSL hydrolase family protein [Paraglaciecola sp.]|uniref:SGNH/GDSL hydrolase family protein n=1 Tax=Paraglaciecola sp. TaxID=1920173 RepID=UPI003298FB93
MTTGLELHAASKTAFLKEKDVLVFIGDSITHGGSYHTNIALFNATRFPHTPIVFVNGGISGDTATGVLRRFDRDIAPHRPTVATIMLGMNDVGRYLYKQPKKDRVARAVRDKKASDIVAAYLDNVRKIIQKLIKMGTRVVVITPSIYDQTALFAPVDYYGVNDALRNLSVEVTKLAKDLSVEWVDFHQPMLEINAKLQENDPRTTIVGTDRVHPGEAGHFVMSYAFLMAKQTDQYVANISIDINANRDNEFQKCPLVGALSLAEDFVEFTCKAEALPFPVSEAQKVALQWVPFMNKLNQQRLRISGLKPGQYSIQLDQKAIGSFSNTLLSRGINLAAIESTPMYQQALLVKTLNDRRAIIASKLRDIAQVKYSMLDQYPETDKSDLTAVSNVLFAHVEKSVSEPWYEYLKKQVNTYLAEIDNEAQYQKELMALHKQLYEENKPRTHHYSIKFVGL